MQTDQFETEGKTDDGEDEGTGCYIQGEEQKVGSSLIFCYQTTHQKRMLERSVMFWTHLLGFIPISYYLEKFSFEVFNHLHSSTSPWTLYCRKTNGREKRS